MQSILSPGRIGDLEIPNRVVRTAHTTLLGERAQIGDAFIAYHERAARGGLGLDVLEPATVHRSSPGPLNIADDRIVDGLSRLMDRMRPHGTRVFLQVSHAGPQAPTNRHGDPPWSASQVQPVVGAPVPTAMSRAMIDEIVGAFAAAAARAERGGLDGVEIHGAHGYLIHSFLSPLSNRREDEFGGDTAGRQRFLELVLAGVREAVSPGFVVGVRVSPERLEGGLDPSTIADTVAALERQGLADFVDISIGSYFDRDPTMGGMHEPPGYQLPTSLPIARATALPCIVTGRFETLEQGDAVIAAGDAAFVGFTRAHLADPDFLAKARTGRSAEIRPCIACDACAASIETGTIGCAVNATAGRETTLEPLTLTRTNRPSPVVVVGGGPAGLEAARVAASRGRAVTLFEREEELGGQVRFTRRAPHRGRTGAIVDWLERETARLGVEVRRGTEATPDAIAQLAPELVVLASGSRPRLDGVQAGWPGARIAVDARARLRSSWEILGAGARFSGTAVVIDDTGWYEAAGAAERLLEDGVQVTYVTRLPAFLAPLAGQMEPGPTLRRFRGHEGFRLHTRCRAVAIRPGEADLQFIEGGARFGAPADTVVFVSDNRSEVALTDGLSALGRPVVVVGDALGPRGLRVAISEGCRAAA